ncbi:MAG: hypothetical protein MK160_02470 [Rhodobacteraceae bacterium]|nr:hypothetical protein [Paracoccaceae bacterium]
MPTSLFNNGAFDQAGVDTVVAGSKKVFGGVWPLIPVPLVDLEKLFCAKHYQIGKLNHRVFP